MHGVQKPNAKLISGQYARLGIKSVKPELEKPELRADLIVFNNAFNILTKDRPIGEVVGYIPYSSIVLYANENGFTGALRYELFGVLDYLDTEYIKEVK